MSINSYQREIYANQLKHAERRNHKYLYKIGDRYIYPDDVAGKAKSTASNIGSMATAAGTAAKTKISNAIADQKTKLKDKKYLWDEQHRKFPNLERANVTAPNGKRVNQITSAHQEGTKKTTALSYQSTHDPISNKVVKVKRDFDSNGDQIGVGYSTESSHIGKKKKYNEKSKNAGFQAEMERRQATIDARNAKQRNGSDFSNLAKAKRDTAKRKKGRELFSRYYQQLGAKSHGSVYDFRSNDLTNKEKELSARASAEYKKHPDWGLDEETVMGSKKNRDAIIKRDNELIAKKEAKDKSKERNKQRVTGKKQLDKIHNRAKAESSAKRTHIDPDNSLSLGRDSMSYDRKTLDQINSAHRGATRKTRYDEHDDNFVLENQGHLTSDSVERQKHKTRLRKLRQRRDK